MSACFTVAAVLGIAQPFSLLRRTIFAAERCDLRRFRLDYQTALPKIVAEQFFSRLQHQS
jgi:hypothetical protein